MPENRKDLVDEQKRRARRRLVGAAVLALAAAVIVPLFLESEPKPLGQDVQILIPAVEGSKFVSQLTPAAEPTGKPAGTKTPGEQELVRSEPNPGPGKSESSETARRQAEQPAPKVESKPAPAAPGASVSAPAAGQAPPAALPPAPAKVAAAAAKTATPAKSGAKADPAPATVSARAADSGFVVQLGAYADVKVAQELQSRLKAAGFAAYVERLDTSKEKLHRVRVGPYPSREAADAARVQLKAKGHSGIVTPLS